MVSAKDEGCDMPTGPKGQCRPADVIGNAVRIARIATGEECDDITEEHDKNSAGGKAKARNLTPDERSVIAKLAAQTRRDGADR